MRAIRVALAAIALIAAGYAATTHTADLDQGLGRRTHSRRRH